MKMKKRRFSFGGSAGAGAINPFSGTLRTTIIIALFVSLHLMLPVFSEASQSVTATKTKNPDGTYSTTHASFTITTTQEIAWEANYYGSGSEGNDYYLYKNATNLIEFQLSTNLSSGLNTGTLPLSPGTYNISIDYFGMGPGTYTVYYNRTAPLAVSPPNDGFGNLLTGEVSSEHTFAISGGDPHDYPVTISAVEPFDTAHFIITGIPAGQQVPPNRTFKAKFNAGTTPGTFPADVTVSGTSSLGTATATASVTGTTLPRVPDIACGSSTTPSLGSADWYTGEVKFFNYSFENTGNGDLTLTGVAVLNDTPGSSAFSPGTPTSLSPVLPNGTRAVNIRFAPPYSGGEAEYFGHLLIHSADPDEPELICPFKARAHHPQPQIFVEYPEINYREVEIGYYFHQAIKVSNIGDGPLTFNISLQNPADPNAAEFDLDLGSKGPIPGGESRLYEMTFHPTTPGAKEVFLLFHNTNETTPTSQTAHLYGSGTNPIPLSTMLVLDRSGSMGGLCGDVNKIEAVREAGILYTELERDAWDWLGITKYNQNNSTPVPLAAISSNRATAQGILNDITGELKPEGTTGIGGAMQKASQEFSSSPAPNAQAMILLTDGKQNQEPWIADVKPSILSGYPKLHIFCVGVGNLIETDPYAIEGVEISNLSNIAEDTDALFTSIQSFSGENRYALEAFYFKAFAKATGRQIVLDPAFYLPASNYQQKVASVDIAACDREADFLIISDFLKNEEKGSQICLQDPTGQIIESGASIGGIGVHVKSWGRYKLIRVKFPERTKSGCYAGTWTLFLKPLLSGAVAKGTASATSASIVPGKLMIVFMASVGSDYRLEASLTKGEVVVNQPLQLLASTTEAWWPMPGATVTATMTRPDGSIALESLYDDGLHNDGGQGDGVYGASITNTNLKGCYKFLVSSKGKTERGEDVIREMTLSKYVGKQAPDRPEYRGCVPCRTLRLVMIVTIVLLLIILYCLLLCCCRRRLARKG